MPRKNLHNFFVLYCILYFISLLVSNDEQIIVPKILIQLHLPIIKWPVNKTLFKSNVRFMSYLKCSNWRRILKLLSMFRCLFTFCYLYGANSIKTNMDWLFCNLQVCSLVFNKSDPAEQQKVNKHPKFDANQNTSNMT